MEEILADTEISFFNFFKEVKKINKGQVSNPIFKSNSIIFLKLNDVRDLDIDNLNAQKIKENIIKAKK